MKDNSFSNFIRNGTPEKKKEVYNDVINESIQDQKQSMTSTIEKEGNLLPHNTTEEWWEEDLFLKQWTSAKGSNRELIDHVKNIVLRTHNLALQQVLEKLEEKKFTEQQVEKQQEMGEWNCYSREEYNEALDDAKSIITSLQKE